MNATRLCARGRILEWSPQRPRPLIMGIVNLSIDSFSGDGVGDLASALELARQQVENGADVIDIGAESAGTRRAAISEAEEIAALLAFITRFSEAASQWQPRDAAQLFPPLLSVNTWRPAVVRAVLAAGGDLLNDIGGLPTDENARVCAQTGAALLIMHSVGEPKVPHTHVTYPDVLETLDRFFEEKLALAHRAGVAHDAVVLDPGIDFAKQRDDNLRLYAHLERFHHFERPILLPVSRKTVIGDVLGLPAPERDAGTLACVMSGLMRGAHFFRVHNVRATWEALAVGTAVLQNR